MRKRAVEPPREAACRRIEQGESSVVDERKNDERVPKRKGWVNRARDLQSRHIEVPNAINIEIEGHRIRTEDQRNEGAADMTGAASFTDAQDRSTQHEGHRDTANDTQRKVVKRGKNKVWQRGRHVASSGIELSNTRVWGYQRVNHQDRNRDHDDRREHPNHVHDAIKI